MRLTAILGVWLTLSPIVSGQGVTIRNVNDLTSITIAIFASSATDPNSDTPVATAVTYTALSCKRTLLAEGSLTDPRVGFFEWPLSSGQECSVDISAQVDALAPGTYKASVKLASDNYGPLSTTFTAT